VTQIEANAEADSRRRSRLLLEELPDELRGGKVAAAHDWARAALPRIRPSREELSIAKQPDPIVKTRQPTRLEMGSHAVCTVQARR
jgi:hypothetical protein